MSPAMHWRGRSTLMLTFDVCRVRAAGMGPLFQLDLYCERRVDFKNRAKGRPCWFDFHVCSARPSMCARHQLQSLENHFALSDQLADYQNAMPHTGHLRAGQGGADVIGARSTGCRHWSTSLAAQRVTI
jgi:hypothetical protein